MNTNIKKLTFSALLTALAIVIPVVFGGFLRITIPPFSATLAAHVPMFIAMLISPEVAIIVGLGSAFGFLITATPVVAARALSHAVAGFVGAMLIRRGVSFKKVIIFTAPVHAIFEALIVIPFGFTAYSALIIVGVGTILHHCADGVISLVFAGAIEKALKVDFKKIAA